MSSRERARVDRADAHPRAAELLGDAFFWDTDDEAAPLGSDTANEVLALFREWREDHPDERPLVLLGELLARWEVTDGLWDVVTPEDAAAAGEDDEFGLLMRDEVVIALAFAQLVEEGTIDPEVQRRALLATLRQGLPMVLVAWGVRALDRATRLDRMKQVLSRPSC